MGQGEREYLNGKVIEPNCERGRGRRLCVCVWGAGGKKKKARFLDKGSQRCRDEKWGEVGRRVRKERMGMRDEGEGER